MPDPQQTYPEKRRFEETPEPSASIEGNVDPATAPTGQRFVIHQHHATRLHHDLRLEMMNGEVPVLVSWAVPRNLPLRKGEAHLAIHVEDHPAEYATFEGTIPKGNYGAGEVRIFDSGTYEILERGPGKLVFRLAGDRMKGVFHLNRTDRSDTDKEEWLMFLKTDERPERDPLPAIAPMMATLVPETFDDDDWLFEPKWDGVRTIAICSSDQTRLVSRNGRDVTDTYPELASLHDYLVCIEGIVDGEIVAMEGGRPSFERLQSRINLQNPRDVQRAMQKCPVTFVVFDLLMLDGRSLVDVSLNERKELLEKTVVALNKIQLSPVVHGEGRALADAASAQSLEGIVAKKLDSPYRPGKRTREWLKIKTTHDVDVVVGGWSPGEGRRSKAFGSLLIGAHDEEGLRFLGAVGTGFSDKQISELMPLLRDLEADECPFTIDPRGLRSQFGKALRDPRWIDPVLVARVEFRELTSQGRLRAPSFKGFRTDKDPEQCRFEDIVAANGR